MAKVSQKNNFIFLLVSMVILLLTIAIVEQFFEQGQILVLASIILCLSSSIYGVERERKWLTSWYRFLIVLIILSGTTSILLQFDLAIITLSAIILFMCQYLYAAIKQVLFSDNIGANQILGSICIYFMLGLTWSFMYLLLLELFGGGFNGVEAGIWLDNLSTCIYFSFITLTTIGYGEITPNLPVTQFFTYIEAVVGSFYLAILVASLVSTGLAQRSN